MDQLHLVTFKLLETPYMGSEKNKGTFTRLVYAEDIEEAKEKVSKQAEFGDDIYAVYRTLEFLDVSQAIK